jgi:hypothetical protein
MLRSLWWREVKLKSLHHQISLVERSKTQITPLSHLFVGEKQNLNHSTVRSLWLREVKQKSLHHQISLVEIGKTQITPPSHLFG